MIVLNARMAKKRKPADGDGPRPDRHKKRYMAPIRHQFIPGIDHLAALQACPASDIVNEAVRMLLEREGLWPPPDMRKSQS